MRLTLRNLLWGLLAVVLIYAYGVQPIDAYQFSAYRWLTTHWSRISNYSHGPLIPLLAGVLVWMKREQLKQAKIEPAASGLAVIVLAMGLYYFGVKGAQEHTVVLSLPVLLGGLALALGGREVFRLLLFPISFLLLMIPLNFLEERIGVPLRHLMAGTATVLLNLIGVHTVRIGTAIHSSAFSFDVEAPCSGIRSLMALSTVTAFWGYVTQHRQWKRWVLFLSAIPLAVLGNLMRVLFIALVAQIYGHKLAMDLHDSVAGFIVFGAALAAMLLIGMLLNFPFRQVMNHWLQPHYE